MINPMGGGFGNMVNMTGMEPVVGGGGNMNSAQLQQVSRFELEEIKNFAFRISNTLRRKCCSSSRCMGGWAKMEA